MDKVDIKISEINEADRTLVSSFISDNWGSVYSVSKGKIYNASNLPGFICKNNNKIIGLITYKINS
jgi:hypothetical protein